MSFFILENFFNLFNRFGKDKNYFYICVDLSRFRNNKTDDSGRFFFIQNTMAVTMSENYLKHRVYNAILKAQEQTAELARQAMVEADQAAQEEVNTMDIYESYRTQYLQKSEMFARQFQKATEQLDIIRRIDPHRKCEVVEFGAIVITNKQKMFVAVGMGKQEIDGETWYIISPQVPIFAAMKGKKEGEEFTFNNVKHKILQIL